MLRLLTFTAMITAVLLKLQALTVTATPGQLSSLTDEQLSATELTVNGSINAGDIFVIADRMTRLQTLDLSQVHIAAYEGYPLKCLNHYDENLIPAGAFAGCQIKQISLGEGHVVGEAAFAGSGLETITLPAYCTISSGAFAGCTRLKHAELHVVNIADGAFAACRALESVALPVTRHIAASAFISCTALKHVEAPVVESIGNEAFAGCTAMQDFNFPESLRAISDNAFGMSGLRYADMSACKMLDTIGAMAFARCNSLREAKLPASVSAIGEAAFFDCRSMYLIELQGGLTKLPAFSFKGCAAIHSNSLLTAGLESIGSHAMFDNSRAESLILPATLEHIGNKAMAGMTGLKWISAEQPGALPQLGEDVWAGIDQRSVELRVLDMLYPDACATDQWREFTIVNTTASLSEAYLTPAHVRGRITNGLITIDFNGLEAISTDIYTVSGICLAHIDCRGSEGAEFDCRERSEQTFLVRVNLKDGKQVSLKLAH